MIEPYNAVGLVPTVWGISKRADIMRNIEHQKHMVKAACWLAGLDLRCVAAVINCAWLESS